MNNLKNLYNTEIIPKLNFLYNYKNIHQVPKLKKIQISCGLGLKAQNKAYFEKALEEIKLISGQYPKKTKAKKSIASFKIRENMLLGLVVTLRREKMYAFLEKLIKLVFPRVRDFRGLSIKHFDGNGSYHFGIEDQLVFPEIDFDKVEEKRGFNISIVTTAKTNNEAYTLLKNFGLPLLDA